MHYLCPNGKKKLGLTDFVSEIKCVEKYPNFENLAHVIQHGLQGFKVKNIREIKLGVTWPYVKRQTAKMTLLPSVYSSLNSRVKIFVFVSNSRRHFSLFMWFNEGLEEKNTNSEVIFAVCRLPFDVRPRNVKLNLSNEGESTEANDLVCSANNSKFLPTFSRNVTLQEAFETGAQIDEELKITEFDGAFCEKLNF